MALQPLAKNVGTRAQGWRHSALGLVQHGGWGPWKRPTLWVRCCFSVHILLQIMHPLPPIPSLPHPTQHLPGTGH